MSCTLTSALLIPHGDLRLTLLGHLYGRSILDFIFNSVAAITKKSLITSMSLRSICAMISKYCSVICTIGMSKISILFFQSDAVTSLAVRQTHLTLPKSHWNPSPLLSPLVLKLLGSMITCNNQTADHTYVRYLPLQCQDVPVPPKYHWS